MIVEEILFPVSTTQKILPWLRETEGRRPALLAETSYYYALHWPGSQAGLSLVKRRAVWPLIGPHSCTGPAWLHWLPQKMAYRGKCNVYKVSRLDFVKFLQK